LGQFACQGNTHKRLLDRIKAGLAHSLRTFIPLRREISR
jgi:hypothetical protein